MDGLLKADADVRYEMRHSSLLDFFLSLSTATSPSPVRPVRVPGKKNVVSREVRAVARHEKGFTTAAFV